MTTAVHPEKGTWEEIFKDYPDQHAVWSLINGELENYALLGRFGYKGTPHEWKKQTYFEEACAYCDKPEKEHPIELRLDEIVALAHHNSALNSTQPIPPDANPMNAWDQICLLLKQNPDDYKNLMEFVRLGICKYYEILIASHHPIVGHFVGRGFSQNKKDADKWLNQDEP